MFIKRQIPEFPASNLNLFVSLIVFLQNAYRVITVHFRTFRICSLKMFFFFCQTASYSEVLDINKFWITLFASNDQGNCLDKTAPLMFWDAVWQSCQQSAWYTTHPQLRDAARDSQTDFKGKGGSRPRTRDSYLAGRDELLNIKYDTLALHLQI